MILRKLILESNNHQNRLTQIKTEIKQKYFRAYLVGIVVFTARIDRFLRRLDYEIRFGRVIRRSRSSHFPGHVVTEPYVPRRILLRVLLFLEFKRAARCADETSTHVSSIRRETINSLYFVRLQAMRYVVYKPVKVSCNTFCDKNSYF